MIEKRRISVVRPPASLHLEGPITTPTNSQKGIDLAKALDEAKMSDHNKKKKKKRGKNKKKGNENLPKGAYCLRKFSAKWAKPYCV